MATFSQGFLSNLGRPAMTQSMFDLGTTIGQMPQQYRAKQVRTANAAELSGATEGTPEWYAIASRHAAKAGDIEAARKYAEMARAAKAQEDKVNAATLATSGELQGMRAAVKEYAAMGDVQTATNLQKSIKDIESKKGVEALRTYANTPGIDLTNPRAKEGFFGIARAYGVENPEKLIEEAIKPKISFAEQADLISDGFRPDNVERFAKTGEVSALGPKSEDQKNTLTEFQKTVIASGVEEGSEEYMRHMAARSEMMSSGDTELDVVSQMQTLSGALQKDPVYKQNSKIASDSSKVISTIDAIKRRMAAGEPVSELNRVLERSASELFNSDSRAASEINRFLEGKGVTRAFGDWFSTQVAGELSVDTLNAIQAVADQAKTASTAEANKKVDQQVSLFRGVADKRVLESLANNMRVGPPLPANYPKNPPKGLTPELWNTMTPEEQSAFSEENK